MLHHFTRSPSSHVPNLCSLTTFGTLICNLAHNPKPLPQPCPTARIQPQLTRPDDCCCLRFIAFLRNISVETQGSGNASHVKVSTRCWRRDSAHCWNSPTTSPPFGFNRPGKTCQLRFSQWNRTLPSPNNASTPPTCALNDIESGKCLTTEHSKLNTANLLCSVLKPQTKNKKLG